MTEEEKASLKASISEQVTTLKRDIERLKEEVKPIPPDRAIGRLTRMEAINSKSVSEANLRTAKTQLAKLEAALPRLDDEEYGICVSCDRPIPFKRLLLMPHSTRCVNCLSR